MADQTSPTVPLPSSEHRHIAAAQYERAQQAIKINNVDYAIQLLLTCCKLDPANLIYRNALRQAERTKYKDNQRGSLFSLLPSSAAKKAKAALRAGEYLKTLEHGEEVLAKNPWNVSMQMLMAQAADELGLLDVAIWILEQARQKSPQHTPLNRALARLYEKRGNFTHAIALWELVRKAEPQDIEAQHKAKDLAAHDTISRGRYEEAIGAAGDSNVAREEDTVEGSEGIKPAGPAFLDRAAREAAPLHERLQSDPTNANLYLQLASIYRKADQPDRARDVLREGLGPTGNHFGIAIQLAELDLEPFRRNLALTEAKLKKDSQNEELRRIRIRLLKEINTRELDLYRQKAARFPTEMAHRVELGIRLLRAGQLDEAIRELQAARSDLRQQWRSLLYLGYCFKERDNWRLAQRNFEDALRGLPPAEEATKKELLYQLARGSAKAGDLPKAIELGFELAHLDFSYRNIGKLLDEWQERLQQA